VKAIGLAVKGIFAAAMLMPWVTVMLIFPSMDWESKLAIAGGVWLLLAVIAAFPAFLSRD
jgi:hypothetical protein